eukprot:c16006_g1_i1.p1 GENE.c16006_g1_i1~~c16006_g1_i1.p1  ORF type:complete len:273 (+),score=112.85 c16006_g1_i1:58-876(+)
MRNYCIGLVLFSIGICSVLSSVIYDAPTITTFSRGFGNDHNTLPREMSRKEIEEALSQVRHVMIEEPGTSFLERDQEEEEEENRFPNQSPPNSVDSGSKKTHACHECIKGVSSCEECSQEVTMSAGPLHFHVIHQLQQNSLIRSVKTGFSPLPAWTVDYPVQRLPDEVHPHTIHFEGEPFVTRPIVLASVMPICDGDRSKCAEGWTDVFVLSISALSTNSFSVNVVRVDSLPNNTWGQQLHIAWIAFEPNNKEAALHDLKSQVSDTHVIFHA